MDAAFRNAVNSCGLSMVEAACAASTRPAALLGLSDRTGELRAGLAADLVVLDAELRPRDVMSKGEWVKD
jgi:N-acetylglucosamine-6-phosphate deacetylase